jgi:dipeptidase
MKQSYLLRIIFLLFLFSLQFFLIKEVRSQPDFTGEYPDECTTITAGKEATADGSVITSHTDDSHRTRSWIDIMPPKDHPKGSMSPLFRRENCDTLAMPMYNHVKIGEIPQVEHTYGFINTAYPCMNEYQVAIGESTFGGRKCLQSDQCLINCQLLCKLMLERSKTAREAIRTADELTRKYGWRDAGECLTIADKHEVWHFEILGPGKGKVGAIWAAQRVPDDHVSVNANASRIMKIDLKNKDYFLASNNVYDMALDSGWCNSKEDFMFCYAYAPHTRTSLAARRREWRVLDMVAPSLQLDPNAENYPFSVKPDKPVSLEKLVVIFKDYYEGTPFNFIKDITVTDENGQTIISPLANPFMPYGMNKVVRINGGWGWRGERTIARSNPMYATIIQCRDWLPDPIGGVVWLALDNVASSIYIPIYCGVYDLPGSYKTPGRTNGYSRESAWWAFNRLGTLTAQRWGDMHHDVDKVWNIMQQELFLNQKGFEAKAIQLYRDNPEIARKYLTDYSILWGNKVVYLAWKLGDHLWTKYDEKF